MSVPLTVAGATFDYPQTGDTDWGNQATAWATAVTAQLLTKAGGTYQLTNELDLGALFGLKSVYFKSRTSNPASAGAVRLARADVVSWRNQANGANLDLGVNTSNQLTWLGVPLGTTQITVSDTDTIDLSLDGVDLTADVIAGSLSDAHIAPDAAIAYSKLALTGSIVNADVSNSAAIAYSKLALTGSIVNADVAGAAAIAYSKLALTGAIVNADVSNSAAIAYSKLALTGAILNADINASAAIAYSKLALTGAILNADINASAAIAYSKLALTGSIVNADIGNAAAIAYSKLNLATSIVNGDISASAAIAYSKLSLTGSIVNADVGAAAAIAYSKLNLATSIVNADVAAAAAIARSKLGTGSTNRVVVNDGSTGAFADAAAITAARALISDANGIPTHSTVTSTELALLSGATSLGSGALVLLNTYTPSSAASVDITSQITSTYDCYLIFYALVPATDTRDLLIRSDSNNGASFDAGASDYSYHNVTESGTSAVTGTGSDATDFTRIGGTSGVGNATNEGCAGLIVLLSRGSASRFPHWIGIGSHLDGSTNHYASFFGGSRRSAAAIDALQLFFSGSSQIASGTVRIYGVKNS